MAPKVRYYPGGFQPNAPQQNRAELWDGGTGLYTAWDQAGTQTDQHPLSSSDLAVLAADDVATTSTNNQATIAQQAQGALATNNTYLGLASPTNAQVAAQVKALTQQNNRLIRLALGLFDGTS